MSKPDFDTWRRKFSSFFSNFYLETVSPAEVFPYQFIIYSWHRSPGSAVSTLDKPTSTRIGSPSMESHFHGWDKHRCPHFCSTSTKKDPLFSASVFLCFLRIYIWYLENMEVLQYSFILVYPVVFSVPKQKSLASNTSHRTCVPCDRVRIQQNLET